VTKQMKQMIAVLAVLIVGAIWYSRGDNEASAVPAKRAAGPVDPSEADQPASTVKGGKASKQIEADDIPVVVAASGKALAGETFERARSLFDYAQSPEELKAIEDANERARLQAEADAKARAEAQKIQDEKDRIAREEAGKKAEADRIARDKWTAEHPPKPVPPRFGYEYIGVIGPRDAPYAILRGPDQKLTYAKSGDVLDRQFRIESVRKLVLDLTYTEPQFSNDVGQVQRTFEGSGNGSSAPAPSSSSSKR
jgi:hypothetical protein